MAPVSNDFSENSYSQLRECLSQDTIRRIPLPAKRLVVGDYFLPNRLLSDWIIENNHLAGWKVKTHTLTERGDYSTIVECDGADWSERFDPEEIVWIAEQE